MIEGTRGVTSPGEVPPRGYTDFHLSQDDRVGRNHKQLKKSILYYVNGPHKQYVRLDMSLTFIFRQGLPGKCLGKRPIINPLIPRASAWDGGLNFGAFLKTFAWKSPTKNKGKAHIYQDVLVGSIYVITH